MDLDSDIGGYKKAARRDKLRIKIGASLFEFPASKIVKPFMHEAALAIANKEQECMALYGGRPWTVTARVTEPKNMV